MPNRICKICSYKLKSNDYYFCSNCGSVLDSDLISKPILKDQTITNINLETKNYFFDYIYKIFNSIYFLSFLLVISLSISFLVVSKNIVKNKDITTNSYVEIAIKNESCSKFFKCDEFNKSGISNIVPYDVDFYVEAFDFDKLSNIVVNYDASYYDLVDSVSVLNPTDIVFFIQTKNDVRLYTVVIHSTKSPDSNIIKLLSSDSNIIFEKLNNYYIISNNKQIMLDIKNTKEKLNKSVNDLSVYAVATNINKKGQMLIIDNLNDTKMYQNIMDTSNFSDDINYIFKKLINNEQNYLVL